MGIERPPSAQDFYPELSQSQHLSRHNKRWSHRQKSHSTIGKQDQCSFLWAEHPFQNVTWAGIPNACPLKNTDSMYGDVSSLKIQWSMPPHEQ